MKIIIENKNNKKEVLLRDVRRDYIVKFSEDCSYYIFSSGLKGEIFTNPINGNYRIYMHNLNTKETVSRNANEKVEQLFEGTLNLKEIENAYF